MKKFFFALFATVLLSPLAADMLPQHFHLDLSGQEGDWVCTASEVRKGRYMEVWTRNDVPEGCEQEKIYITSTPTANGQRASMHRMMKKALFPVKYMPGTRTSVQRESEHEAVFEWRTPSGHQAVVRICVEGDVFHTVSHMSKGSHRLSDTEIAERAAFLDTLKLTFSQ